MSNLALKLNFTDLKTEEQDTPVVTDLLLQAKKYYGIGMKAKAQSLVKHANLTRAAIHIEKMGFVLLHGKYCIDDDFYLDQVKGDGKIRTVSGRTSNRWTRTLLKNSKITIPDKILNKLPDNIAEFKTYVFEQPVDPIIAIRVKGDGFFSKHAYYVAIAQWE